MVKLLVRELFYNPSIISFRTYKSLIRYLKTKLMNIVNDGNSVLFNLNSLHNWFYETFGLKNTTKELI